MNSINLVKYINDRFGYGSYTAPLWFVGMEEGGGDQTEFERGVQAWVERGMPEVDDVRGYHEACGVSKWFEDPPAFQKTWNGLISIALSAHDEEATDHNIRRYQADVFAQSSGREAVLELFPLPAKSLNDWIYEDYAVTPELSFLANRRAYRKAVGSSREEGLRSRIRAHQPRAVVYYGLTYWARYERLAGVSFKSTHIEKAYAAFDGRTLHVLTLHPADFHSKPASYFEMVGELIRPTMLDGGRASRP